MQRRIYVPALGLGAWQAGLAKPDLHWKRGRSAFETAVFWELGERSPRGLHPSLAALLDQEEMLRDSHVVAAFPEHQVPIKYGSRASQNDVWAILRAPTGLVSLAVEGKAGESFGETVGVWRTGASENKTERLKYLCEQLGVPSVSDSIGYQLMHRAASALIEADRIGAAAAAMIVLSFADDAVAKAQFREFVECVGGEVVPGRLAKAGTVRQRPLFVGWLDVKPATDADVVAASA